MNTQDLRERNERIKALLDDPTRLCLFEAGIEEDTPVLTREEEVALFNVYDDGLAAAKLLGNGHDPRERDRLQRAVEAGEAALQAIVGNNLRLVLSMAHKYTGRGIELEDLFEFGIEGLMKAIVKYEQERGLKFSTHATWWIRHGISHNLPESGPIRLPSYSYDQFIRSRRAAAELAVELDREPTVEEIAERTGIDKDRLRDYYNARFTTSMDAPIAGHEKGDIITLGDCLEDESPSPVEAQEETAMQAAVREAIDSLDYDDRAKDMVRMYYGLPPYGGEGATLGEVGDKYDLSRERARQIIASVRRSLRHPRHARRLIDFLQN